MNLYNLHISPESLLLFKEADEYVLEVFWDKYRNKPGELRKRERAISKYAEYSYYYVRDVLKRPFPAGEAAIAKDAYHANNYARDILKGPFPAGEAAIAKDQYYAIEYAKNVLKKDFYFNGKLIAKY